MKTYTLKAGLLVGLNTTMNGNVTYRKEDVDVSRRGKTEIAEWKTERTIADKAEHERAKEIRSRAVYLVRRACVTSAFGYLCPAERGAQLTAAIAEARGMVETFNASAKTTRLGFYVILGRIESSDKEAARAISSEVAALLDAMQAGLESRDVKAVREAAERAKALAAMLDEPGSASVERIVATARALARRAASGEAIPIPEAPAEDKPYTVEHETVTAPAPVAAPVAEDTSDAAKALAALRKRKADAKRAAREAIEV